MDNLENEEILIQGNICKSISGQEDENGNYIFEVEASNENLDLQNQITLQSALMKSKEYFLTNGVISDDHLHKTRNPDGSVETHKDKIIGEPISIRTEGKSTFVKGILYAGVKAAKDYINLLKNNSTRVKASIGGIMPKVRKNADGSETVTSFMWNDLALTCSPVNWTVGSAKFAKSITMADFCKSLNAGYGTDAMTMDSGRSLQSEDIEDTTTELIDITNGDLMGDEDDDLKKSDTELIKETVMAFKDGEISTPDEIESYLIDNGYNKVKARETALEIIKQGGNKMSKSHFSEKMDELLKSMGGKGSDDDKDTKAKSEDEDNEDTEKLFDDSDFEDEEEPVKKGCDVKKSMEDDYIDATAMLTEMGAKLDALEEENAGLKKSLDETQEQLLNVTKSLTAYLETPNTRSTVMQKSMGNGAVPQSNAKPTQADFEICKSVLIDAARKGKLSPNEVQFYNSEFQKAMKGQSYSKSAMDKIKQMVRESR